MLLLVPVAVAREMLVAVPPLPAGPEAVMLPLAVTPPPLPPLTVSMAMTVLFEPEAVAVALPLALPPAPAEPVVPG